MVEEGDEEEEDLEEDEAESMRYDTQDVEMADASSSRPNSGPIASTTASSNLSDSPQSALPKSSSTIVHREGRPSITIGIPGPKMPIPRLVSHHPDPKKEKAPVTSTSCSNCGTTTTPLWRRADDGQTICNACEQSRRMNILSSHSATPCSAQRGAFFFIFILVGVSLYCLSALSRSQS
ncbi:MAG: hypothetical protein JOS17DRAFT_519396 [Linnemannia elongata]|nr:MAG: hypothetical protein JOS17DRAFT_519396 [Linnemannia elongata]